MVKSLLFRRRRDKPRAIPPHLGARPFSVRGNSGARLSGHRYPAPHGHPKGVVVLAHPDRRYAQHWFTREGWIDWLHEHGYSAVTFDFSRYGGSRGGSTYLHDDLLAVARHTRGAHPGVPVHVVGISIGAFALANAAPHLDFAESILLESPYPAFLDWYAHADAPRHIQLANRAFQALFPTSAARIQATHNIARASARRILVVAMQGDTVTPTSLSHRVAVSGPPERTRYLELSGAGHLEGFRACPEYRMALLEHLNGRSVGAPPTLRIVPGTDVPATAHLVHPGHPVSLQTSGVTTQ